MHLLMNSLFALGELEDEFGPYGNEGDDLDLAAILADEEQYALTLYFILSCHYFHLVLEDFPNLTLEII